jgi:hypothetical protein
MNDQTTPSGSRWEPEAGDATPVAQTRAAGPLDEANAEARRAQLRGRAVLAGAATALVLGGGLAGFVIGHATGGDDGFRPADFTQQGPGGQFRGQLGDRHQGPPPFRGGDGAGDGHGDRDRDGLGPPQGSDDESSSGADDSST